jgi:NTE family protein
MRGLAHIGVLRVLEDADLVPSEVIGSSVGALVGAAWCAGWEVSDLHEMALSLRRRNLFRLASRDMALKGLRSPALYQRQPVQDLILGLLGDITFAELERPLFVNTVELSTGAAHLWGPRDTPGSRVADAVYASCALPGYLPPLCENGHVFADGASVGNLPLEAAAEFSRALVIAVDVGSPMAKAPDIVNGGFALAHARAVEIGLGRMRDAVLRHWAGPPLLLLQPEVSHIPMFSFTRSEELIEAGMRTAAAALRGGLPAPGARGVLGVRLPANDRSVA